VSDIVLQRVLYATGARRSAPYALRSRDLQPRENGRGQVTVRGNGNKTRSILVSAATWAELSRVRDHVQKEAVSASHLCSQRGRRNAAATPLLSTGSATNSDATMSVNLHNRDALESSLTDSDGNADD
jgi:site-specific recombinase XerD